MLPDDAIKGADNQIKKIWESITMREKKYNEDWLIVITTDHGRDAPTGKNHGGQSDRERTTWIVTNTKDLNARFKQTPGVVDILPSILNHMNLPAPEDVQKELDGVSFIGPVEVADLRAEKMGENVRLTWKNLSNNKNDKVEIYFTETNNFKDGKKDSYKKAGNTTAGAETFTFPATSHSSFYKILVKAPHHYINTWIK